MEKYTVSIVIAVKNEAKNISILLERLVLNTRNLSGFCVNEIVFVSDDSIDGSVDEIRKSSAKWYQEIPEIKVIERSWYHRTVDAQIVGVVNASGNFVLIMDGDLQHDPSDIPRLLSKLDNEMDVVVASRINSNDYQKMPIYRKIISRTAMCLVFVLIPRSRNFADPLSGFFIVKRELIANLKIREDFNKILIYLISQYPSLNIKEVKITLQERHSGNSKFASNLAFLFSNYINEIKFYRENIYTKITMS